MKKLILMITLGLAINASAQVEKGTIMVGGGLGLNSSKSSDREKNPSRLANEYRYRNTNISPLLAYFIASNLAVGLVLDLGSSNNVYEYFNNSNGNIRRREFTNSNTNINLFIRNYFMLTSTFGIYAGLQGGPGSTKGKERTILENGDVNENSSSGSNFNVGANAGLAFFPNPHIGITAGFGGLGYYSSKYNDEDNEYKSSNFNFNVNSFLFSIGMTYHIFK